GHYIINNGGKRLRPLLCLLTTKLFANNTVNAKENLQQQRHIILAVLVEFLHTASLLHDDVVDESYLRRGEPSANGVWGNQASVLVGDFLFARAYEMSVDDGDLRVLKLLSRVTHTLAEGEVLQLVRTFHLKMSAAEHLEVIERKTAILFSAATELGAMVAHKDAACVRSMHDYGMFLGVAFQLMDDALDYSQQQADIGKPVGHDLEEGKITLPLIYAMQKDDVLKQRVQKIAERGGYADDDRQWLRERVIAAGGIDFCLDTAASYAKRSKLALADLSETYNADIYHLLGELADFSAKRTA
ncbi:MAG: polyprenyl synthetase family protein, partial [Mariprofundales bacterium]